MIKQLPNNEQVDILCHHSVANKNMKSGKIKLIVTSMSVTDVGVALGFGANILSLKVELDF